MRLLGYAYLRDRLNLGSLPVRQVARVRPVTRIQVIGEELAVPSRIAPSEDEFEQVVFALKHEGTDLAQLAAFVEQLDPELLVRRLRAHPSAGYLRKLGFVWEKVTGKHLQDLPGDLGGIPVPLFDPKLYLTVPGFRDAKWRVDFNGLGDFEHCPSVRLTPQVQACLALDPVGAAMAYLKGFEPQRLERILGWAYLSETRGSFALEGEGLGSGKAEAFAALLRQAHTAHDLTEQYLSSLQNIVLPHPLTRELNFRVRQNHLSNGAPGSAGVTYVPPPPMQLAGLLTSIGALANGKLAAGLDPLVRATLASFGFVFAHPFLDGNGRLSRFLAHYTLCQSGAVPNGYILPLSVAMKRHESEYLSALTDFSKPARQLWDVCWIAGDDFEFTFKGHPGIYRYWDATAAVEFMGCMAEETLEHDIQGEAVYLDAFDATRKAVEEQYDVQGSTLTKLIRMAWTNNGTISLHRRKQFANEVIPEAYDLIEKCLASFMSETLRGDPQN